jgi:hypothetical protein
VVAVSLTFAAVPVISLAISINGLMLDTTVGLARANVEQHNIANVETTLIIFNKL